MTSKEESVPEVVEEEQKEATKNEEVKENSPVENKPDPFEELKEQLTKKDQELAEQKDDFLREKADLENYRKRLIKDKEEAVQFANQGLLKELVQIKDNLGRALEAPNASLVTFKEGVEMIQSQFSTLLKNQKVEPVEALGKPFDPNLHEVMSQQESEEHDENIVIQEYSKGYTLNGRILRPTKVVISKKPSEKSPTPEKEEI